MFRVIAGLKNSPLAKKTLLMMSFRLALVVTIAAIVSYLHIFSILNDQVRDSLKKYISERGEKESAIFLNAERNHRKFSEEFLRLWPQRKDQPPPELFRRYFVERPDGSQRLHEDAFSGIIRPDGTLSRYISGYIGSNAPDSPWFQNKLFLSYQLIDRFAESWTMDYANLYVSMPENVNLVYWPGVPWGDQADTGLDVTVEEWVYVASPASNPERLPAWTGLYYDQTADEWMVSLETPVDQDGTHLINIGHDILLNTLFDRVFNDKLAGTYNFIFRGDGRIIAHPELVEQLQTHKGVLHADESGDQQLQNMISLIGSSAELASQKSVILEDLQSDSLLAVTRIDGPDWYFVTYYPGSLLTSTALQTAWIVSVVGLLSLLVELIILFYVLRSQVLDAIGSFRQFSRDMSLRRFSSIYDLKSSKAYGRDDEVGELAESMAEMAGTIQKHEQHLVELVNARTRELSDTNAVLQTIARDVSGLQGTDYFSTLGDFLANSLDADFVIICRLSEDQKDIHTLSANLGRKPIKNLTYPIVNTPCEQVIKEGPQIFNGNVQECFPLDQDLVELDLHSYIGTPMFDSSGDTIGHLAVMKHSVFEENDKVRMIIDSVSNRAASELVRHVNEEIITRQATTDSLTGLANRTLFIDRLTQTLLRSGRQHERLAVIFIDVDHFKLTNDQLGHAAGDELLRVFAQRLRQCVRKEDTVARLGGDEFIVLLDSIDDIYGPEMVSRHIQQAIAEEVSLAETTLTLSCSMGVAVCPDDGNSVDVLINHADTAMYRAKELGRNNVQFFTASMNARLEQSREIEHELRRAISGSEFIVYYQPVVCLKNRVVRKLEALVRWVHPQKGVIGPDTFIPVAEQSGQITVIGEMVLRQVCKDFNALKERFGALESIAVNCSTRQFRDSDFAATVADIVDSHGLSSSCIEIEITESLFIDKEDQSSRRTLTEFHRRGFSISLDDFGTGYSSLAYLKRLPINTLKIDRSFIGDIVSHDESLTLVKSIIDLAHNFRLKVVAEGVETREQRAILIENGCDFGQGYYYSPPQPLEELTCLDVESL